MNDALELLSLNEALRERLREAEEILEAVRSGAVDALVGGAPGSRKVFSLEGAETPYRAFVEAMHEGAATVDVGSGVILYGNEALAKMLAAPLKRLIGSPAAGLVVPEDSDSLAELLRSGATAARQRELRVCSEDGTRFTALFAAAPLNGGGASARVALVITDKRERERGDAMSRLLEEAEISRASEERFRTLVTATSQIVWQTNSVGEAVGDVPSWREFTGQSAEDIQGRSWAEAIHPDDRARAREKWSSAITARRPFESEFRLRRHDGHYHDVAARGAPILDADGTIREWLGTCTDISERKRAEAELDRFRAELEQRVSDAAIANESLQRQTEELRRLNEERATLGNMNELLPACSSAGEAYEIFGGAAAGLFPSLTGVLHVYAAARDRLAPAAAWGPWPEAALSASPEDCWGLRRGRTYLGNGVTTPPCAHAGPARDLATLCVPLMAYGEVFGVLHLRGPDAPAVQSTLQLATMVGDGLALTLANLGLRESLKPQPAGDPGVLADPQ